MEREAAFVVDFLRLAPKTASLFFFVESDELVPLLGLVGDWSEEQRRVYVIPLTKADEIVELIQHHDLLDNLTHFDISQDGKVLLQAHDHLLFAYIDQQVELPAEFIQKYQLKEESNSWTFLGDATDADGNPTRWLLPLE